MTKHAGVRLLAALLALGTVTGIIVTWWAARRAPYRQTVAQVVVKLPRSHGELTGLTIAFLTDTHVNPFFRARRLEPLAGELESIRPDIVAFGGDYISGSSRYIDEATPVLARIARTARLGAWGVLGNHDMANSPRAIAAALSQAGITPLKNEALQIQTGQGDLWLVGIDDAIHGKPDLTHAFAPVPAGAASICLWHEPDLAEQAAAFGPFLQLSGHTHGGQVRLPLIGALARPKLGKRYVLGRFTIGDMELYVSPGLGVYKPPVRLFCPPELTIVRLID